jgi:hypothetical protein
VNIARWLSSTLAPTLSPEEPRRDKRELVGSSSPPGSQNYRTCLDYVVYPYDQRPIDQAPSTSDAGEDIRSKVLVESAADRISTLNSSLFTVRRVKKTRESALFFAKAHPGRLVMGSVGLGDMSRFQPRQGPVLEAHAFRPETER